MLELLAFSFFWLFHGVNGQRMEHVSTGTGGIMGNNFWYLVSDNKSNKANGQMTT